MLRKAYYLGVKLAVQEAGMEKSAGVLGSVLSHPAFLGGALGMGGGLIAGQKPTAALRSGLAGASVGAGVRYLPGLLKQLGKKFPKSGLITSEGYLKSGVGDLSWMIPSLLVAPAIAGESDRPKAKRYRSKR